jgi:hypothetical protein
MRPHYNLIRIYSKDKYGDEEVNMFLYNQAMLEVETKQAQLLEEAKQQRLAIIAQGGKRRFRFLSWRLPDFRRQPVTPQPKNDMQREVRRKTASNQGW